jgi:hypothetical protein
VWRGSVDLPAGGSGSAARVLLVNASGILVDSAMPNALTRSTAGRRRSLRYRNGQSLITLRPNRGGSYNVRVSVRGVDLGAASMPLLSASLQVGAATFADSLSCARPRGRHVVCRG